jgi:hypothetical protein
VKAKLTTEAEMIAFDYTVDQSINIQKLLSSVGIGQGRPYNIYNGNQDNS